MSVRIKVCGFTRADDVRAALDAGVDALGLNLARGPRRIELEQARSLAALIPPFAAVVALFLDAAEDAMLRAAEALRPAAIQLHGDEPPEIAERLRRHWPVIKAFRIASAADLERVRGYPADAFLLDASVPGVPGGSGATWDHRWLSGVDLGRPVILAGGLGPANVAAAIRLTRPWGVDTASGVESAPGLKDAALMRAFVAAARGA